MLAEVYTKSVCPHCDRAKMLLKNRGITITEVDAPTNMAEMVQRVEAASGQPPKTVPQIFLDGKYIGGADELAKHFTAVDLSDFEL